MNQKTTVINLRAGDVLAGSGFTVIRNPYASSSCAGRQVIVEGFYPGKPTYSYKWNRSTTVSVVKVEMQA